MTAVQPGQALTAREVQVMDLIAQGLNDTETGTRLGITADTVSSHLRRASIKLQATGRWHAVVLAHQGGVIRLPVGARLKVVPGHDEHRPHRRKGFVSMPVGILDALEACARAAASGQGSAAARFGVEALRALDGPKAGAA